MLALSPRKDVVRRCQLLWGVHPRLNEEPMDTLGLLEACAEVAEREGFAQTGRQDRHHRGPAGRQRRRHEPVQGPHARVAASAAPRRRSRNARAFSMLPHDSIVHQRPERFFELVVEGPLALLARAGLEPLPAAAAPLPAATIAISARDRAVHARAARARARGRARARSAPAPTRDPPRGRAAPRLLVQREAVVLEQDGAQPLAHVDRAPQVGGADGARSRSIRPCSANQSRSASGVASSSSPSRDPRCSRTAARDRAARALSSPPILPGAITTKRV